MYITDWWNPPWFSKVSRVWLISHCGLYGLKGWPYLQQREVICRKNTTCHSAKQSWTCKVCMEMARKEAEKATCNEIPVEILMNSGERELIYHKDKHLHLCNGISYRPKLALLTMFKILPHSRLFWLHKRACHTLFIKSSTT